ncbi:MAG: aspartate aminotransferase family protein [Halolamina sp.]
MYDQRLDDLETAYRERTPESRAAAERASEVFPGGDTRSVTYHPPYPSFVAEASGCTLTTNDGEELVDFLNNYTQAVLGHAPEGVVEAVQDRFARGNGLAAPTDEAVELGERLVERVPSFDRLRFCNSGTEATMNAIRAARAHTGNERVLKVRGGYHGSHDTASVWVSGPGRENPGIPTAVEEGVEAVPYNDTEALKEAFAAHDDLACFVLEPFMGAGGTIPATPEYLETARDLTDDHDALLVFDEVVSFRLAHGGLQSQYGVEPDLTALGKLIGGGLPVGAFGGREDVMALFHPEDGSIKHSGTFSANPATMAGGIETLAAFDADVIAHINDLGGTLRERLRATAADVNPDVPVTVTGKGSLFQIHLAEGPITHAEAAAEKSAASKRLFMAMRNEGIFMAPRGMGNLSTPMTETELDRFVDAFEAALGEL